MNEIDPKITSWLKQFESNIRNREYEIAFPLYAQNAVAFGTRVNYSSDMNEYAKYQWNTIWDKSRDFTFVDVLNSGHSGELYFCSTLWTNLTNIDGIETMRKGRASFVFRESKDGLICIHSHFSESPNIA
jgi:ketosteroid isomerase-like protein